MSTTCACSQADDEFYVLGFTHQRQELLRYSVWSPDCQAMDISAPTLLGHGCGVEIALLLKWKGLGPLLA